MFRIFKIWNTLAQRFEITVSAKIQILPKSCLIGILSAQCFNPAQKHIVIGEWLALLVKRWLEPAL